MVRLVRSHYNLVIFSLLILSTSTAIASDFLNYSGRLVNPNGSPVAGPVDLVLDLAYTNDTSTILCTKTIAAVPLVNGIFHLKLDFNCGGDTLNDVLMAAPVGETVAIRVTDTTPTPDKVYAFQAVYSVPYTKVAETSKTLGIKGTAAGQVLKWDGTKWEPGAAAASSGGTVTEITAGTGLSGGTITTTGTIAIANGGVSSTEIANSTIVDADISATAAITRAKLAGGTPNYVIVNNGAGGISEVQTLSLAQGGTGAVDALNARINLGLGSAALAGVGNAAGNVMQASDVPSCLANQKLQMGVGPAYPWTCVNDLDTTDSTKLPLSGGSMAGDIDMAANKITDLAGPTADGDAANKKYVDDQIVDQSYWVKSVNDIDYNDGKVGVGVSLRFKDSTTNFVEIKAPAAVTPYSLTLPPAVGTNGQVLTTTAAGVLSWSTVATTATAVGGDLTGTIAAAQIGAGVIVDADVNAGAAIVQSKIAGLVTDLSNKENSITAGDGTQFWRGDKTWQTLNTAAVPESGNLYFTQARVLTTPLTGFATGATDVVATDTALVAFGKLQGQIDAADTNLANNYVAKNGSTMSGNLTMGGNKVTGLAAPTVDADAATKLYVDGLISGINASQWTSLAGNIYYNGANVGIGTTSPQSKLDISGSGTSTQVWTRNLDSATAKYPGFVSQNFMGAANSGYPGFNLLNARGTSSSPAAIEAGDTLGGIVAGGAYNSTPTYTNAALINFIATGNYSSTSTPSAITFSTTPSASTSAAERLRIDSTGNVGIGTNNPNKTLTIQGGTYPALAMGEDNSHQFMVEWDSINDLARLQTSGHSYPFSFGNGSLYIGAGNAVGKVGVGTTNPTSSLQIRNAAAGTVSGTELLKLESAHDASAVGSGGIIRFSNSMAAFDAATIKTYTNGIGDVSLKFQTGYGALADRMTIANNGNVGIGNTAPAQKLQVKGAVAYETDDSTNYVSLKAPNSLAATYSLTLPPALGAAGQALTTDAAGILSWATVATTATSVGGDITGTIANAQIAANAVGTTEIADGSVTYSKLSLADGDIPQAKVNGLVTALSGKEPSITAGTTAQYWRGDKTWQTLNTTAVPEGTNMYHTSARVMTSVLGGYSVGTAIPLATTDTVSEALGKLEAGLTSVQGDGRWNKNGTNYYYNGGSVGIGNATPRAKLDVASGDAYFDAGYGLAWGANSDGAFIKFISSGDAANLSYLEIGTTDNSDEPIIFTQTGLERMRITSTGITVPGTVTTSALTTTALTTSSFTTTGINFTAPTGDPAPSITARTVPAGQGDAPEKTELILFHSNDFANGSGTDQITLRAPALSFQTYLDATVNDISNPAGYNERMVITPAGNVGIGSTTPAAKLHVHNPTGTPGDFNAYAGSTVGDIWPKGSVPEAIFQRTGGAPIVNQLTYRGGIGLGEGVGIYSLNHNTAGSSYYGDIRFHTTVWNGVSYTNMDRMIIDVGGNVGIGNTSPSEKLQVSGNIHATAYLYSSDKRLKKNIQTIQDPLKKVLALRGVNYEWKKDNRKSVGFIAQEVELIFPEAVRTAKQDGMKSVEYGNLVAPLLEAFKASHTQHEARLKVVESENKKLKNENQELKKRLDRLEQLVMRGIASEKKK